MTEHGLADHYAAAILRLAGYANPDPRTQDTQAAIDELTRLVNDLPTNAGSLIGSIGELLGRIQAQDTQVREARRYARWLLHQGSSSPAVDVLVDKHGPLPDWLAEPWTEW